MNFKIASLAVSLIILAVLIYFSNFWEMVGVLSGANIGLIFLGVCLFSLSVTLRNLRWQLLLRQLNIRIGFRKLFPVFMGGMFISNVTPAKSGDPVRSYLLKRKTGHSFSKTLPSLVMERIMDILLTIIIVVIGFFFVQLSWMWPVAAAAIAVYAVSMVVVIYVSLGRGRIESFFRFLGRVLGWVPKFERIREKSRAMALNFNESFVKYNRPKTLVSGFLLTIVVWFLDASILYVSFLAIGIGIDFLFGMFVMVLAVLIGVVSSLPGGLGSSEAVMTLLFSSLLIISLPTAMAGVLLCRLLSIWLTIIVGALFFRV